ncbi:hypothetical protein BO83DRAFT_212550 [Aspergillus eucalypticola CBS 122712]|uniref:Uncharacterized protein n=1 Tax=Aspergillus eucalypticola (strain CBS 122712 / IBT 29274) TaxID=1448314 RepID=A0A317W077_ASPEC|nr:uncharacterized protein BO83DRAFT_212550 [Aspergillus eucalypticola CBS 122712]PWY78642.1 hypothetical protein BO83DRAFT_212550 [Aspergillus eucalypticola CBS 122712]
MFSLSFSFSGFELRVPKAPSDQDLFWFLISYPLYSSSSSFFYLFFYFLINTFPYFSFSISF